MIGTRPRADQMVIMAARRSADSTALKSLFSWKSSRSASPTGRCHSSYTDNATSRGKKTEQRKILSNTNGITAGKGLQKKALLKKRAK